MKKCEFYFEEGNKYCLATDKATYIYRIVYRGTKYIKYYLIKIISNNSIKEFDFSIDNEDNYEVINMVAELYKQYTVEPEQVSDLMEKIAVRINGYIYYLAAVNEVK